MTSPARLRPSEVLAGQIATLRAASNGTSSEFVRGALTALTWLVDGGSGPLTTDAAHKPVTISALVHELAAAEAAIYGRRLNLREYAQGVEHALMWAQYATAAPPIPSEARPRHDRTVDPRGQAVG